MKLSKPSIHAALAMAYLGARHDGRPIQARQVAAHLGIPDDSALKILQALVRGRIVQSQPGRAGGYQLVGPAEQVTLLNIVEAIDGPIVTDVSFQPGSPSLDGRLAKLRAACERATVHVRHELSQYTVADVALEATGNLGCGLAAAG